MHLRRSTCYVKVFDLANVQAAIDGPVDAILFDLEDGVAPANKPQARTETARLLKELDFKGKERVVRVNAVDTEYYPLDMEKVIRVAVPDSVRVPKCDTVEDVRRVDEDLSAIEKELGLEPNSIEVWAMIESPIGIRNAYDIAKCCQRVTALTIGMEDLNRSLGVERRYLHNELDLIYARQKFVLDAKAAGVQALDTPLLVDDDEINCDYTLRSRQMGFDGRAVTNSREAAYANKVYSPSPETFDWADRVVQTYEECAKQNIPCEVDGKSICYAVYRRCVALQELKARSGQ